MKLINVDDIDWQWGTFIGNLTRMPLPVVHKIATIEMLRDWQEEVKAIPIPEAATNGDVIKAMFPNIEVKHQMEYGIKMGVKVIVYIDKHEIFELWFPTQWWNAPYKRESEVEL